MPLPRFRVRTLMIVVAAVAVVMAGIVSFRETFHPARTWWIQAAFLFSPCWMTTILIMIFCLIERSPDDPR